MPALPLPKRLRDGTLTFWSTTALLIGAVVVQLYGRSIGYGLFWDDPVWFRQGAGQSIADLIRGSQRYQFYRPLSLAYFQWWWRPDGSLDIRALHLMQVAYHLVASWLVVALARQWRADRSTAVLAGLVFAVFPFSHQAVSWAAPQQPLVTVLLLASVIALGRALASGRGTRSDRTDPGVGAPTGPEAPLKDSPAPRTAFISRWCASSGAWRTPSGTGISWTWYALALVAFSAALLVQESALALVVALAVIAWHARRWWGLPPVVPFAVAGAIYAALWWHAPRLAGVAGGGLDGRVGAFLLQAAAFPIARWLPASAAMGRPIVLAALLAAAWLAACAVLVRAGSRRIAALATVWVSLALLPEWVALPWTYMEYGQRLVYQAVPGIALFWSAAAVSASRTTIRWVRVATVIATVSLLGVAIRDVVVQDRALAVGAAHLFQAVAVAQGDPDDRPVFVNFPDRYALRRPPYPLGYWGVTLAPAMVVEIGDFARATTGTGATTQSWSVPATGGADRERWPYGVDMRGVIADVPHLLDIASDAGPIYLSDYRADGGLDLRLVGSWRGDATVEDADAPRARLGDSVRLRSARIERRPGVADRLVLAWQRTGEMPPDATVFVHVFGPDGHQIGGADGDAWGGMLPCAAWPIGEVIEDVRDLGMSTEGDRVTVGIYRRTTNDRFPARAGADGARFHDDEVPIDQGSSKLP
jgi:hypothetical protein